MALLYHPYLLLFVILLQLTSSVVAFSSSSPSNINNQPSTLAYKNINNYNTVHISKVQTNNDILSLAKLRYQEWMINEINPPILSNFCKATAEIYNERKVEGSIVFLAKLVHQNDVCSDDEAVVGAAELSSIELQNCIINSHSSENNDATPLYITDVVTSSNHRRYGIGTKLMVEVEKVALYELNTRIVFLHVEYVNLAARKFYERLGYVVVSVESEDCKERGDAIEVISISLAEPLQPSVIIEDDTIDQQHDIITLDTKQLAINAGTVGQLLMMKRLSKESIPKVVDGDDISSQATPSIKAVVTSKGGFGRQQQEKKNKKKRTKRMHRS